ncbi:NAD(P)-binding protein [Punctularia strigosozonata HHB-11173 SS5]|uniref:NAD(P)-binding protein n=1 Tax=Punctularia strigosozonata (strain HHB-11173) TaxID=741275 RepID=UPI00044171DE|nr:NAD(P)-binding protein [Punctularia strigosozonata HHB-11173 SS5]EIN11445.1 NAD(P)-binding protein [Punctularia strigosozonata HHB-11173 SS5]
MSSTSQPRVWFITGASAGFGLAVTKHVLEAGDIAVATLRKPSDISELASKYPSSRLLVLPLDVTKPEQVSAAFARTREAFGRIDVVYNNAGVWMRAEVEGTTEEEARRQFEINYWGALRVSIEAVKFFREVNPKGLGGRLLQVSSVVGVNPWPLTGPYATTKFALEGITDALRKELDPAWNIKVTIIEPGMFGTRLLVDGTGEPKPIHPAYNTSTSPTKALRDMIAANSPLLGSPQDVTKGAREIYRLAGLESPPERLPLGKDSVAAIRDKLESQLKELAAYESWSSDLA